ncbi:MAG TPA: chalcone isomerase family protein [Variovorax sp.]|nr:chalcone isomerase family protein [Variovorax sp.]
MTRLSRWIALAALMTALGGAGAAPIDLAGVKIDDSLELNGNKLQLNGAGIRFKAVFKVYTASLYLGKKCGSTDEVLAATGAKRMSITMLRDIDANELGKLFTRGVEDNSPRNEYSKLIPGLLRMSQVFSDQKNLRPGDTFTIDWVPGKGTVVSVKGVPQGDPIKEEAFFNALMRIWLGSSPADYKLKDALLGVV